MYGIHTVHAHHADYVFILGMHTVHTMHAQYTYYTGHPSPLPGGSGIRRLCLVGLAQASVGVVPCVWVGDHGILRRRTPR